jgi:cobalamin biosynthesis protein CobT
MATTTTAKIAEAISILSDALTIEVAHREGPVFEDDVPVPAQIHEELKTLVEDFATENLAGLEVVQNDLQTAVGDEDEVYDDEPWAWNTADDDSDSDDEDDEETDTDDSVDDDDETQPTDEEKVEMLVAAGDELQEQIDEHENTIKDLKNTIRVSLDVINELVTAAENFHSQAEDF